MKPVLRTNEPDVRVYKIRARYKIFRYESRLYKNKFFDAFGDCYGAHAPIKGRRLTTSFHRVGGGGGLYITKYRVVAFVVVVRLAAREKTRRPVRNNKNRLVLSPTTSRRGSDPFPLCPNEIRPPYAACGIPRTESFYCGRSYLFEKRSLACLAGVVGVCKRFQVKTREQPVCVGDLGSGAGGRKGRK